MIIKISPTLVLVLAIHSAIATEQLDASWEKLI